MLGKWAKTGEVADFAKNVVFLNENDFSAWL